MPPVPWVVRAVVLGERSSGSPVPEPNTATNLGIA